MAAQASSTNTPDCVVPLSSPFRLSSCSPAARKQGLSPAVMNGGADGTALGGCKATGQTVGPGSPSWGHHPAGGCGAEPRAPVPMGTIRTAVAAPCPQACLSAEHQWTSCWGRGHPPGPHPEAPAATPAEGAPRPSRQAQEQRLGGTRRVLFPLSVYTSCLLGAGPHAPSKSTR